MPHTCLPLLPCLWMWMISFKPYRNPFLLLLLPQGGNHSLTRAGVHLQKLLPVPMADMTNRSRTVLLVPPLPLHAHGRYS